MKRCFVSPGLHRTTSLLFLHNCSWCSVRPVEFLEQPDRPCHNGRTDCRACGQRRASDNRDPWDHSKQYNGLQHQRFREREAGSRNK